MMIWVVDDLARWLVAWRHQAITWTNIDFSSVRYCGINLRAISREPQLLFSTMSLKTILLRLLPYLPRANELHHLRVSRVNESVWNASDNECCYVFQRGPNSSSGKKAAASNPAKTQAKSATQLHSKSSRKPVNNLPSRAGSAAASHRPTTSSSAKKPANNSPLRLRQNNATKSGASGSSSQSTSSASAIPGPSHTSSPLRRADSPSAMLIRKQSADAMSNSSLSEGMLGDTTFGSSTTLDDDSVSMCSCRAVKGSFSVPVSDIESEGWPEALLMDDSMGGSQSSPGDPQHECESADDYINWELTAPIHFMPDVLLPVWSVQFLAEVWCEMCVVPKNYAHCSCFVCVFLWVGTGQFYWHLQSCFNDIRPTSNSTSVDTAPTWETWIQIWTTWLFLDANTASLPDAVSCQHGL